MRLSWETQNPRYEHGTDRGVLFVGDKIVPWMGLISVDESFDGGEMESYIFDGRIVRNVVLNKDFRASITAFSTPPEFAPCIGEIEVGRGLFIMNQHHETFDLSYRTTIGDDLGYKIHLVYNATVEPSVGNYKTLSESVEIETATWEVHTVPERAENRKPTSHFTLDSTQLDPFLWVEVENLIYGWSHGDPRLPDPTYLLLLIYGWRPRGLTKDVNDGLSEISVAGWDISEYGIPGFYVPMAGGDLKPAALGFYT